MNVMRVTKECDERTRVWNERGWTISVFQSETPASEGGRYNDLEKFFVGVELTVFVSVVEGNVTVGAFFELVDFAGVERLGVNVNADGALIVFGEIENLMDGFERVDVTGIGGVHFVDVGGNEFADAGVVGKSVTVRDAEILDF